ncbi:transmembrane protein, putative [Bodo saltans]|uniref:Transmembrane protein, putative n=1 Tax=Bodo saltans TaxID=75058 RepID=A0A0S4JBJ8_BODSA|nr:transmembrane protein, putative [Bodo saltans]|eukprot:CUG87395.1 transmembrane protein, putative [Bodo saltans]
MAQKKGDSFRQSSFAFTAATTISELVDCTNVALIWPAYTFLLPPTVAVGVTLVSVHVDGVSVAIGIVGVLLALSPWLVAVRGIWRKGGACEAQPSFTRRKRKHERRSAFVAVKEFLLEPSEQLY